MKKIILFILVIMWMGIIFCFSSFSKEESLGQSNGLIYNTICKIVELFDKNMTVAKRDNIAKTLSYPVRKLAHITEFLILCILVLAYINCFNIDLKSKLILTFIICFVYACSDEIHQIFSNRGASFIDVIIDSIGVTIYLIGYYIFNKKRRILND